MATVSGAFFGVPSFFRARCRDVSQGGTQGYRDAGRTLGGHAHRLVPNALEEDEWHEQLEELEALLNEDRQQEAHAWIGERFPKCLALVPKRRQAAFLEGFAEGFSEALSEGW